MSHARWRTSARSASIPALESRRPVLPTLILSLLMASAAKKTRCFIRWLHFFLPIQTHPIFNCLSLKEAKIEVVDVVLSQWLR